MKTLNDLGLHKKTKKKVEDWLQEWLDLFEKQANHKHAWVYRANFEGNDFFYFTDCKDILEKDPEAKGQENNLAIRSRKRKIMMQLFLKTLLGQKLGLITITCNHCGYRGCWIEGLRDGNGHWVFCPKCKKTDVHVFPGGYDTCMDTIQQEIAKKTKLRGFSPPPEIQTVPCAPFIKEIQAYKYEHAAKNTHDPGANPKPKHPFEATLGKFCPKCEYPMNEMVIYLDTSLTPVDGWHCPNCMYQMAKRKVPRGAWSTVIKGNPDKKQKITPTSSDKLKKCSKCGAKNVPFRYTVDICDHCYCEENPV